MITVNVDELLNKIKAAEIKEYLSSNNYAVVENLNGTKKEDNEKKIYDDNIKKIQVFTNGDEASEKSEIKKFQSQCNSVIRSSSFNINDLGKKTIKKIVQSKLFDTLVLLLENHRASIDDDNLCVILYELLHIETEPSKEVGTPFKQSKEKLAQDNAKFKIFLEACSEVLNLPEDLPSTLHMQFLIYIISLICQRPIDKVAFLKSILRFNNGKIQLLLEILYLIAVPLNSQIPYASHQIKEQIVFEYISNTVNVAYERIRTEKGFLKFLELISKELKKKNYEAEAFSLLSNLNKFSSTQSLKLENVDLRKNLNIEEFLF